MSLTTLIKVIQDIMRKDVGVDGDAQRISQMVWLIFLKIFDDKEQEWQLDMPGYKSPISERFRWSNWAKNVDLTGGELIDFVNNDLFPSLKRMSAANSSLHGRVVGLVFEDAYNYMKSGFLLRQVINTIENDVDFNRSGDHHLFNDIYETILSDLQSAGNAGEYYTPRAVTQFMVDMLDPQLGQTILDPACGTGGFLTCAIEHLNKKVKTKKDRQCLQNSIYGIEKKPLPYMLAMTNMILHGIDTPINIRHDNTLTCAPVLYNEDKFVDLIITNPPFGGIEEDGIEKNFPLNYQTRETADLFMVFIMNLLKENGKAAVVLPDGFLFGEGVKVNLKRRLLEEFNLHTIVRLPKGVFSPYTNIATNILFFEKGRPTEDVWFFEHPYPEGYKSYSRSKPLTIAEFDLEKNWWGGSARKGRKTGKYSWKISVKELISQNYNFDCKNPYRVSIIHRESEDVIAEYKEITRLLEGAKHTLRADLMSCLKRNSTLPVYKIIEQNFDFAFSGNQGVVKLRELILTLAMQGKLLEQLNEPPASELLKSIRAEKQHLIKTGNIKRPKNIPDIELKNVPYQLPLGWEWVRLDDICSYIQRGKGPEYVDFSTHRVISQKCVRWQGLDLEPARYIEPSSLSKYEKNRFLIAGDLLWNSTGTGTVGRACLVPKGLEGTNLVVDSHVTVVRSMGICSPFLWRWIQSPIVQNEIEKFASGTTNQIELNTSTVINYLMPLPPLLEQYRIVAKVDQLMNLCAIVEAHTNAVTNQQTELLKSILAKL